MGVSIHPTAIVDSKAQLGQDVSVGPYCIVEGESVALGDGVRLDAHAQVKSHTTIGAGTRVHSFACLGGEPQHLGFKGEDTVVEIGANCIIREYVTVHRGTAKGLGYSRVGDDCMLMAYVHVAHDCELGKRVIMANAASLAGHVHVGDFVTINGMSGVHQFVRIGEYAFLGAMGGFTQDVPPFTLATGVRAKLHGLNSIGLRRCGFPAETISALKQAYKQIWSSDMVRDEALAEVEASMSGQPEVQRLIDFIRESKRGVTPPAKSENGDNGRE